jgi:hypothetical protein
MTKALLYFADWLIVLLAYGLLIGGLCALIERKRTHYVKNGF